MVASATFVDSRCASHFTAADKEDLVLKTSGLCILDKGGYGVIEGASDGVHSVHHVEVIAIGMHVPNTDVAGVNGDKSASGFTQPAGGEEKFSNGGGLSVVVSGSATIDFVPCIFAVVLGGIIELDGLGIFVGQVEGSGNTTAEEKFSGLFL